MHKIFKKNISKIKVLCIDHNVKSLFAFGSVCSDKFNNSSDIDLLIEFEGRKSLLDLVDLKLKLQELLGRKVDVQTYNSLDPLLRDEILNEQEVIF